MPECDLNFQILKQYLIKVPTLQYPNNEGQYKIETDASNTAIDDVLQIKTMDKRISYLYVMTAGNSPHQN